jgi:HNH endonuclease
MGAAAMAKNNPTPRLRMGSRVPLSLRFWAKVNRQPHGCWLWTGATAGHMGYGTIGAGGGTKLVAHRLSWELHHRKPIPDGMLVCHHCDTPRCVRPDHLFLGTHDDNMLDAAVKGRKGFVGGATCPHGHAMEGSNLIVGKNGKRRCRTCKNANRRKKTANN